MSRNKDINDALSATQAADAVDEKAPEAARLNVVELHTITPEKVNWLWFPRIPVGRLTMVDGDPGIGKSWFTLALAAAVSTGKPLPGQEYGTPASNVLLVGAEDGVADTIVPRLITLGADLTRIRAIEVTRESNGERAVDLGRDLPLIEEELAKTKAKLLIIDPVQGHIGAGTDIHRANEVRGVLAPLAHMADVNKVAVLLVRHLRKASGDKALYRGLGSIDFAAAARSVLVVGADPEDETRRGVAHVKSSLARNAQTIAYRLDGEGFQWLGEAPDLSAERMLSNSTPDEENSSAVDEAVQFLNESLQDGPKPAKELLRDIKQVGISERTLYRAKSALNIVTKRVGGTGKSGMWVWALNGGQLSDKSLDSMLGNLSNDPANPRRTRDSETSTNIANGNVSEAPGTPRPTRDSETSTKVAKFGVVDGNTYDRQVGNVTEFPVETPDTEVF